MVGVDGPGTRRSVQHALDGGVADFHSPMVGKYVYVDAAGKRSPRWTATHVRLSVYYVEMGRPLDELRVKIAGLPGCTEARIHPGDDSLRPQVIALFGEEA